MVIFGCHAVGHKPPTGLISRSHCFGRIRGETESHSGILAGGQSHRAGVFHRFPILDDFGMNFILVTEAGLQAVRDELSTAAYATGSQAIDSDLSVVRYPNRYHSTVFRSGRGRGRFGGHDCRSRLVGGGCSRCQPWPWFGRHGRSSRALDHRLLGRCGHALSRWRRGSGC